MKPGFSEFNKLMAELEADPESRAELIAARQELAREFYKPGDGHYERLMRGEGPAQTVGSVHE